MVCFDSQHSRIWPKILWEFITKHTAFDFSNTGNDSIYKSIRYSSIILTHLCAVHAWLFSSRIDQYLFPFCQHSGHAMALMRDDDYLEEPASIAAENIQLYVYSLERWDERRWDSFICEMFCSAVSYCVLFMPRGLRMCFGSFLSDYFYHLSQQL